MVHRLFSGRVAEWQTRWLQVPVSFGTWGFKSPFAHTVRFRRTAADEVTYWFQCVTSLFRRTGLTPSRWGRRVLDDCQNVTYE